MTTYLDNSSRSRILSVGPGQSTDVVQIWFVQCHEMLKLYCWSYVKQKTSVMSTLKSLGAHIWQINPTVIGLRHHGKQLLDVFGSHCRNKVRICFNFLIRPIMRVFRTIISQLAF